MEQTCQKGSLSFFPDFLVSTSSYMTITLGVAFLGPLTSTLKSLDHLLCKVIIQF